MNIFQAELFLDFHKEFNFGNSFLMLGDILCQFTYDDAVSLFKKKKFPYTPIPQDKIRYCHIPEYTKWHYIHMETWMKLLGINEYTDCDINEKAKLTLDLNEPIPKEMHEKFDVIGQYGTLEHIFDIKTTLENIGRSCKVGGFILHAFPVSSHFFIDHGYYQISPSLFTEYYSHNKYNILKSLIWLRDRQIKGFEKKDRRPIYDEGSLIEYDGIEWRKFISGNREIFTGLEGSSRYGFKSKKPLWVEKTIIMYFLAQKTEQITYKNCYQTV